MTEINLVAISEDMVDAQRAVDNMHLGSPVAYLVKALDHLGPLIVEVTQLRGLIAERAETFDEQVREWLANTTEPVGPGKVDTPAALQQRLDAAVPGAITELRAEVAAARERDEALTDRLIDAWHDGHGGTLTLHAYLGLTWDEYCVRFGPVKPTDPVCTADVHGLACNGIHLAATPAVPEKETTS